MIGQGQIRDHLLDQIQGMKDQRTNPGNTKGQGHIVKDMTGQGQTQDHRQDPID